MLFFLILSLKSFTAFAECPSIQDVFPFEGMQALSNVQNRPDYDLQFLYSPTMQKMVVLLGESHIKDKASSVAGAELMKHIRLRAVEGAPAKEIEMHSLGEKIVWRGANVLARFKKKYAYGSTIRKAISDGLYFDFSGTIFQNGKRTKIRAHTLSDFEKASRSAKGATVWLENGDLIDAGFYKRDDVLKTMADEYTLDCRNDRMVPNIIDTLNAFSDPKMLVIVGSLHVSGIMQNLRDQHGFEHCDY